jgi:hypothetical protein
MSDLKVQTVSTVLYYMLLNGFSTEQLNIRILVSMAVNPNILSASSLSAARLTHGFCLQ